MFFLMFRHLAGMAIYGISIAACKREAQKPMLGLGTRDVDGSIHPVNTFVGNQELSGATIWYRATG